MAEQVINESIIRKLQNLLAMAERSQGNEAEAQTAMNLAQQLMARHNLDIKTITGTHVAGGTVKEKREKTPMPHSAAYQWQVDLWGTVALCNFCKHWVREMTVPHKRKKKMVRAKRHVLLGKEVNVLSAQMMGAYLCDTIERVLPYPNSERMSTSAHSWRAGCAERLRERMYDRFTKMQKEDAAHDSTGHTASPGTAMVMRSVVEQEEAANYDAAYGDGAWARRKAADAAWEAGYADRQQKEVAAETARLLKLANETPAERKAREKEEAKQDRANERYWQSAYNRQSRKDAKVDYEAVRAGREAGGTIGLDKQVGAGSVKGRL
jgi:hypothetical protein